MQKQYENLFEKTQNLDAGLKTLQEQLNFVNINNSFSNLI